MVYLLAERDVTLRGDKHAYLGVFARREDAQAAILKQPEYYRWKYTVYPVVWKDAQTPESAPP